LQLRSSGHCACGLSLRGQGRKRKRAKDSADRHAGSGAKTIQDNLGGGTISETTKETDNSKTVYGAHVKKSGGEEVEIKVAEDGKLIGVGKENDAEDKD
jgi:hypothetical protein